MTTGLLARATLAAWLSVLALPALGVVTYSGDAGVRARVFTSNSVYACTNCHNSALAGASRNSAPVGVDFDVYASASANGDIANSYVQGGLMPYTSAARTARADLSATEKALLQDWVDGGLLNTAAATLDTLTALSVSKTGATLRANVTENGIDTTFTFRYSTSAATVNAGGGTSVAVTGPAGSGGGNVTSTISSAISGLSCGTTYYYAVHGGGNQGDTVSFSTSSTGCPTLTTNFTSYTISEDDSFALDADSLGEGASVSYALSNQPAGMTISSSTGVISWTVPQGLASSTPYNNITITATGNASDTSVDTFSVTVNPANDAPTLNFIATQSATEGVLFSYQTTAADVDGNSLTYDLDSAAKSAGLAISSSGNITWTPPQATSNYSRAVTVYVTDGIVGSPTSRTFTINVAADNDAPVITAIPTQAATEHQTFSYQVVASDPEGASLTYDLDATSEGRGLSINSAGLISWGAGVPEGTPSSVSVTVSASDGSNTPTRAFTINVTLVNDAPVITGSPASSATEDTQYQYQVVASDPEGQGLYYDLQGAPAGMLVSDSGLITWTPLEGVTTSGSVTLRVGDGLLASAGTNITTKAFTVNVSSVNDAPSVTAIAAQAATEHQSFSYQVVASDPENDTLIYDLDATSKGRGLGINSSGYISWTVPEGTPASVSVTVSVDDQVNPVVTRSFTINVTLVNDAPVVPAITNRAATEHQNFSYTVSASDPEGQTLRYALDSASLARGMSINSSGQISWNPVPEGTDPDVDVTVSVSDGPGGAGTLTTSRTFTIDITLVNDAPVVPAITNRAATEHQNFSYTVSASDPEGQTLRYALDSASLARGMSINSSGQISWNPVPEGTDPDVDVTVSVSDGPGGVGTLTTSRTFTIDITLVNDAPVVDAIDNQSVSVNSFSLQADADDPDHADSALTWSLTATPKAPTVAALSSMGIAETGSSRGRIDWNGTAASVPGIWVVTVTATDGALSDSEQFEFTIEDDDGDGVEDFSDNCPAVANATQTNTDTIVNAPGDSLGDACDTDDDNDRIPDAVEVANGLDPLDDEDANDDLNNDGDSNYEDYVSCGAAPSCYALSNPQIVTNGDQTVTATGYFTPVTLTATATGVSGELTVTADEDGPFRPGIHTVTWSAPWTAADGSPQTATTTQNVTVKPLVTMGGSRVIGAGQTTYIPVRLIGEAPSYPVTVTFSTTGAVENADFVVTSHSVQFDSPETLKYITVTLPDNGPAMDKDLVLTLTGVSGEAVLADASQVTYTLRITTLPAPPDARLLVSQKGELRRVVYVDDGSFVVDALVTDPNGVGSASCTSWFAPAFVIGTGGSGCQVIIDPSAVTPGLYPITVSVTDGDFSVSRTIDISLAGGSAPALSGVDTDGDGAANNVEMAVDANGNGLLDYLDVTGNESPESIQLSLSASSLPLMAVTDSGLRLVAGSFAVAAQAATQAGIQVYESQVTVGGTPVIDKDNAAIGAIYDFAVDGLSSTVTVAHVVLPLPVVLLGSAQWRVLGADGQWQNFSSASANQLSSAPRGDDGTCPPPQDAAYTPGLGAGNACVQLIVTDGGPNDADGVVNGSVRVTGAPTVPRDEIAAVIPSESQGGGSADLWTLMLLALAMLAIRRKEPLQ